MRLTITKNDGAVYKDERAFLGLVLEGVPENVTALQWFEDHGWIEYANESEFRRPPNEAITQLPEWANVALVKWQEAHDAELVVAAANPEQAVVHGAQTL